MIAGMPDHTSRSTTLKFDVTDTSTLRHDMLSTEAKSASAFKVLMIHGFCNSHYVSHFAAFFIVARAKTSIVESLVVNSCISVRLHDLDYGIC